MRNFIDYYFEATTTQTPTQIISKSEPIINPKKFRAIEDEKVWENNYSNKFKTMRLWINSQPECKATQWRVYRDDKHPFLSWYAGVTANGIETFGLSKDKEKDFEKVATNYAKNTKHGNDRLIIKLTIPLITKGSTHTLYAFWGTSTELWRLITKSYRTEGEGYPIKGKIKI